MLKFNFPLFGIRFLVVQFNSTVKRKANSAIEQQMFNGHEKLDRLLVSLLEFQFQLSQQKKNIIDPVFSNWVNFIKKLPIIICFEISECFKSIGFYL